MRRCYEKEHWQNQFGEFDYYHCGNGNTINGVRYCSQDCKLGGYFGWCACKDPPEEKIEQITFLRRIKMINDDFVKYENNKRDEYIRLDTTVIGIDNLIAKASNAEEANALFKAKDVIYSQQRYLTHRQLEPLLWIDDNTLPNEDMRPDNEVI